MDNRKNYKQKANKEIYANVLFIRINKKLMIGCKNVSIYR